MITIDKLREFAKNGDQQAVRLINEIERYEQAKEQELNIKIKDKVNLITQELAKPDAITDRTGRVPLRVIDVAEAWLDVLGVAEEVETNE